jgi:hypothetical protein
VAKIRGQHRKTLQNYKAAWTSLLTNEKSKSTFTRQLLRPIKSEFSYLICSYLKRLIIQNSWKCTETLHIFFGSASKSDRYFFINCYLFIELSTLIPLQLQNRLWTTVVLFYCCTLIWCLTNNNYNLYFKLLQFMTVSVNTTF